MLQDVTRCYKMLQGCRMVTTRGMHALPKLNFQDVQSWTQLLDPTPNFQSFVDASVKPIFGPILGNFQGRMQHIRARLRCFWGLLDFLGQIQALQPLVEEWEQASSSRCLFWMPVFAYVEPAWRYWVVGTWDDFGTFGMVGLVDWSIVGAVDWDGRDGWDGRGVASTIPIRPLDSDPTPIRA